MSTTSGVIGANTFTNGALNALIGTSTRSVVSSSGSVVESAGVADTTSGTEATSGSGATSSTAAVGLVDEGGSLTIQTTDGAEITVRFGTAGVGAVSQSGGSASAAFLSVGNMQVQVDGTLSSADAQAVSNVLSQVDSLATQYFSGDVQDAFAAAANLSADPSEIAGMNLSLMYTGHVYQATTTSDASTGAAQGNSASTQPATPDQTPAPTQSSTSTTVNLSDAASGNTASGAGGSPLQVIMKFLQDVSGKLGRNTNTPKLKVPSSLKLQLLARSIAHQEQGGSSAKGAAGSPSIPVAAAPTATSRPTQQAAQLAAATLSQMAA